MANEPGSQNVLLSICENWLLSWEKKHMSALTNYSVSMNTALFGRLPCELTLQYNQMWDKPKWSQVSVFFLLMELLFFPAIPHPGYALIYCMLSKPLTTLILFSCSHTFCMLHKCLQNDLHSMPVEIRGSSINLLYSIINLLYLWNYAA